METTDKIALITFRDVMYVELSHTCTFMRLRGICDSCFVYQECVRTLPATKLASKSKKWFRHLEDARSCRHVYRESQRRGLLVFLHPPSRLGFAAIYYDFARQLSFPMMADQTMNEFSCRKRDTMSTFSASSTKVILNTDANTTTYMVGVPDMDQILSLLSYIISLRIVHHW